MEPELGCKDVATGEGGGDRGEVQRRRASCSPRSPGPSSVAGHAGPLPCDPKRPGKAYRRKQMSIPEKQDYPLQELGVVLMMAALRYCACVKAGWKEGEKALPALATQFNDFHSVWDGHSALFVCLAKMVDVLWRSERGERADIF